MFRNIQVLRAVAALAVVFNHIQLRFTDNFGAHGLGFTKFDGSLTLGGAGDNAHLVGAVLTNGRCDLAQPVDDFFFDLFDHCGIAKVDFAHIDRAEFVTPFVGFGRDFVAHSLAHGAARL